MSEQWLGLITGVAFGALLQQGRVLRFEKQVGALLLKDMTIMKFMLSAILVGMVGINLLAAFGFVTLSPKATVLGAPSVRWPRAAGTRSLPSLVCWSARPFSPRPTRIWRRVS